jgi:hypothetical protein
MSGQAIRSRLEQSTNMSSTRPCYRHAAGKWLAYCPDCTAWHLAAQSIRCNAPTGPRVPDGAIANLTAV